MSSRVSFPRDQIPILLLEGIHERAVQVFHEHGYTNVERLTHALPKAELIERLADVRVVGLRSRTKLDPDVIEAAPRLLAGRLFLHRHRPDRAGRGAAATGCAVFNRTALSSTRSVAELVIADCP